MDGGPFRGSRPADRAVNRPEPIRRQPEEPHVAEVEPKAIHRTAAPRQIIKEEKSLKRRLILPAIAVLIVIILGVGGWFAWSKAQPPVLPIDTSKYQAVFFTNGQVYFGKLKSVNNEYMSLTDIYYLQSKQAATTTTDSKNPQQTSNDQTNVQLVKLGDEIHGPEDKMVISKDQVLFYEDLKTDGKVAQSIQKYKNPS